MVPAIITLIAIYPSTVIPPAFLSEWPIAHRPSNWEGLLLEIKFASTISLGLGQSEVLFFRNSPGEGVFGD